MADDLNITGEEVNIEASAPVDVVNNSEDVTSGINNSIAPVPTQDIEISNETNLPNEVNFEQPYPDTDFDVETFNSAITFATEGMPNMEINQPFKDMIDRAAVDLDKYPASIAPNNDINSIYPGRSGSSYDPFRQSSGIPDFNTSNGRRAIMSQSQDIVAKQFPNQTPGYKDPYHYGAKRYEMDRYYRHPRFADLGFHPFANNEEYFQKNSSKWDNFTRTRGQWSAMYGPAFTSGWRSLGDMFTGDTFSSDLIGAQAMDDAMRIGRSGSGGARGFVNDLFLNSSYTVGIISSIALEELALFGAAAVQGGMNPAADALLVGRTAQNVGRLGSLFKLKTYTSAGKNMMQRLKQINTAKRFWAASRTSARALGNGMKSFLTPELLYQMNKVKAAAKAGDNMTQMAKGAAYFGGFYRDIRAVNAAWSESKMEAGLIELEERDQHYMDIKRFKNGVDPSMEEMEMIAGLAKGSALKTQFINMPLIYLSNKIVLDGALRGFKPLGRIMDESLSGPMGRILRNPKSVKSHFYDIGGGSTIMNALGLDIFRKMIKVGVKGSFKHLGATGLRYSTANVAEGLQELGQEATAAGVKAYYKGIYEQDLSTAMDVQLAEMVDSYQSGEDNMFGNFKNVDKMNKATSIMEAAGKGVGSQMSGQGMHTFMSGFLMGGMVQGPQKVLFETMPNIMRGVRDKVTGSTEMEDYRAQSEKFITNTVETLNKVYQDPNLYFDPKRINLLTQKELNSRMMGSSYADNILEYMNDKDHAIFSSIYTVMQSGQLGAFREQVESFTTMDNQTIKEAFSDIASTPQKLRSRAQAMLDKMNDMEKTYESLKDEYVNPFDSKKYKKGTRKHQEETLRQIAYDHAKMMLMFSRDTFEQSLKRSNEIYESLASDPVLASISSGDIAALTSLKGLLSELDLLKGDIKVETDPKRKKNKEQKLKLLQDYFDIFTEKENQTSRGGLVMYDNDGKITNEGGNFDRRKIGKLKPAFVKYLKFLAEQNDDYVITSKVDETLKKIVDFGFLKGRSQDYFKAMENLMNPDNMVELAERMSLVMKGVWEDHKNKNNQLLRLKKYVDQQERIEFLKALSDKGIQPDAEQTKKFLEDGTIPNSYFDNEGVITPASDPAGWQAIESLQKNLRQMQGDREAELKQDEKAPTELEPLDENPQGGDILIPSDDEDDPVAKMEKQAARIAALQAFLDTDTNTSKLLKDKYDEYKEEWALSGLGTLSTYPQWIRSSEGGAGILRSRYEMSKMYETESTSIKDEKTFEEWIDTNSKNPLLVGSNGLLTKNGVTHSDVSINKSKEVIKEDKFDSNEKILNPTAESGVFVVETTITEKDGTKTKYYTVVDKDNVNAATKYAALDPKGKSIKKSFSNKTDALNAAKFIERNLPKKSTFNFSTGTNGKPLSFTTGDIVVDSNGKKWMVRSTSGMIKNNNNLYLVPVDKKNAKKGDDSRIYRTEAQWKEEGWKKALVEKADLQADNITRLHMLEPIKFYPFQGKKVKPGFKLHERGKEDNRTEEEAKDDWQEFLRDLTPMEMLNLRVVLEKNPEYIKVQEEIKTKTFRTYRTNPGYKNNPDLATGANEYEVTLMLGNKPVGKLVGMGATILRDIDGSVINGQNITQKQAERLFITRNDKSAAATLRKRYAYADLIDKDFKAKLGKNSTGTFNLTDFPNIKFMISNDLSAFTNSKGENYSTPWEDLYHKTINGNVFIYDMRTVYDKEGNPSVQTELITDIDTTTPEGESREAGTQFEINQALNTYVKKGKEVKSIEGLKMGRYVAAIKLPNGTITFVELKSDKLETQQLNDILFGSEGILNQMQKTSDENFKDGKLKVKTDSYDPSQFNDEYNKDFERKFYVSLNPGEYLNIGVTQYGKLSVYYTNRKNGQNYKMTLSKEIMEGVTDINGFIQTINANWKADQKAESVKAKKNKSEHKEIKLELTEDKFVNNIPKVITSPESLVGVVSARIAPEIRTNIQAQFVYTDSAALQAATSSTVNRVEATEDVEVSEEISPESQELTNEIFEELLNLEFDIIPEGILNRIREKIINGEELTEQDLIVVEAYNAKDIGPLVEQSDISSSEAALKKKTVQTKTKKERERDGDNIEIERNAEIDEYYTTEEEGAMVANPEYGPVAEQIGQSWLMQKDKALALKYYERLMELDMTHQERHDKMLAWMEKKNFNMRKPLQYIENEIDRINAKYDAKIKKLEETVTDSNLQAESNNETIIAEINRKEKELKEAKKSFAFEMRKELEGKGITKSDLNKRIRLARRDDQILKDLQSGIDKLRNSLGYKIVDNFDGQDVEDIDVFTSWAIDNLPSFIQIEDIEDLGRRLKNNGITVGAFALELSKLTGGMNLVGKIYTSKLNPFKYHEAFHSVFRMLLNESEIKKYLKIAKYEKLAELKKEGKTLAQALSELKELSPVYQKMGRKELEDTLYEEYLADEFEKFKMDPRSSNTSSEVKSIFTRILEWIKNVFLSYSPNELNLLFNKIDTGKYKSVEIASNRFTTSDFVNSEILDNKSGITNVALKAIPMSRDFVYRPITINGVIQEKGKKIEIIKYFSQQEQNAMIGTVGAMYLTRVRDLSDQEGFTGEYNPDELLKETLDDYIERYNPEREDDFYSKRTDFLDIEDELTIFYEGLDNSFDNIASAVKTYLELFDVQVEDQLEQLEKEDFTAEGIVKAADAWDSEANQLGGFKSLSSEIRKFIATTTVKATDRFGVEYDQPVNYVDAYNGLLKSLKNTTNPKNMIAKMELFAQSNDNTEAVVDRIYDEIGFGALSSEQLVSGEYDLKNISNPLFFQSIIKGFTQFRIDYIFAENDAEKGVTNLYAANHKDDAHTQTDSWSQSYGTKFEEISKNKSEREKINTFLGGVGKSLNMGAEGSISDSVLQTRSVTISIRMNELLGIRLSPEYIKYSIVSSLENLTPMQARIKDAFGEAEPFTAEDIQEIKFSISSHSYVDGVYGSNLFLNIDDVVSDNDVLEDSSKVVPNELGDVKNKLKRMARGNAIFDESVGNTVFLDPKGNLIYAHQQPTMHLEKVAELNSEDAITALKNSDGFLESNYLLNNEKFKALARQGKLRISRIIGSKMVSLDVDENGNYKSGNGLDLNKKPGVSFGESSPAEFITNLVNSYLLDYNAATGKVKTTNYNTTDEFGNSISQDFASAIVDIKVIAESNTGDFIGLPIIKAVEKTEGEVRITDEYISRMLNEVETEYNKISREVNKTEGYTEKTLDNYNDFKSINDINDEDPTKHKGAKLFKTGELLTKRTTNVVALNRINLKLGAAESKSIKGTTTILLKAGTWGSKVGITVGIPVTIEIDGTEYTVTNRGNQKISDNNLDTIKKELGSDISDSKSTIHKYEVKKNNIIIGYTRTMDQMNFLLGKLDKNIIEIKPSTEVNVMAKSGEVERVKTDDTAKRLLEDSARGGLTFSEALKNIKDFGISIEDLIRERLTEEFNEFDIILNNIRAKGKIDKQITSELKTSKNKTTAETKKSMGLFNLLPNEADHNLMQWFLNDMLNTMSINQILLGDVSMTVKDAVDEVKRAKMQNAAGPSAESVISAEKHGVMHPVKHISTVTFRDSLFKRKFSNNSGTGDKTDAQMYMTTKAFRYMMFGFGSLNSAQALILNKIEAGEDISWEEFFGNAKQGTEGFKKLNAVLNSKKLVYADGKTFIKMSAIVLTPALTTDSDGNALPNRVALHNMRVKLERMEDEGNETIGIAVPESASKMLRANVIENSDMFNSTSISPENITGLDARWMRLQQIVPSNKIEIVDPGQIKQLITSEQSDNVEVIIGGKTMTIGEVREAYNKTVGDRVELKYLNKRNLIFNFANSQNELQKSIDIGRVTVDLQAFLEYAKAGLESSQAKSQFLELFEVDETGSPKYDLNNPITIQKFQELFMGYFSKNVLRERQPGHSVALMSDQGMKVIKKVVALDPVTGQPIKWEVIRTEDWKALRNKPEIRFDRFTNQEDRTFSGMKVNDIYIDDLRANVMEYDSKGNETGQRYSEFMLPPHFAEIMKHLKPGQPIPDVISKAFATRIPSQDKHSSVNLRLVDFMPVFYGSTGVFPEELIEISGADFDIDKLYMQIKEFYMNKGEFVEYGKSENPDIQYKEYVDYQRKAANKKGTSINEALNIFKKRGSILDQQDFEDKVEGEGLDFYFIGALRLLSLPVTKDEFIKYTIAQDKMPYEGAQNNAILDQRYALLGNDGMSGPLFGRDFGINQEPAVIDPLETIWDFIQSELPVLANKVNEDGVMVDNALGKLKAWTNNKAGANSIGAVVLPNIVMNLLKEYGVKIINKNKDGAPVMKISINGHNYDTFGVNYEIDPKTGKQMTKGTRTQFVISALVTAMTDNAKERLAAKLGLNKDALAVVTNLVALGVGVKTAILMINNPLLKQLYFLAENKDDPMDPGIKSLVRTTLNEYKFDNAEAYAMAAVTPVTDESMIRLIQTDEIMPKRTIQDTVDQIALLMLFQQAHLLKETTSKIQSLVTLISGMGRDTESLNKKQEDIDDLGMELSTDQFDKTSIPIDVRRIFRGKSLQSRYYKIWKEFRDLTPAVFITRTEPFVKLTNLVVDNLNGARLDQSNIAKIEKDILSFLTGKAYIQSLLQSGQGNLVNSLSSGLIYDEFTQKNMSISDVLLRVRKYLTTNNKTNFFAQKQLVNKTTSNGTNKSGINQVQLNTWSRLSDSQLVDMQNSMIDLYQDINTRADAIHLVHYLMVKDGLQYGPNSFISAIPAPLLEQILSSSARVHNLFKDKLSNNENYSQVFGEGVTFNSLAEEMTEGYLEWRGNAYYLKQVFKSKRPTVIEEVEVEEVETEQTSEVEVVKEISGKTIVLDNNDNSLTIDLLALVATPVNKKKYKGKKGVFNRKYISNKNKVRKLESNIKFVKDRGFQVVERRYKGTTIKVAKFPLVITFVEKSKNETTGKTERTYRFFKLEQLFTPLTETDKDGLFDVEQSQNIGVGNKAVYKETKMLGSMQQNGMGFVYGPRTEYDILQEAVKAQQPLTGIDRLAAQANQTAEAMAEKMAGTNIAEKHFGAKFQVEANENETNVVNDSGKAVDLSKLQEMSKDNEDMHTGNEAFENMTEVPEGRGVNVSKFYKLNAMNEDASVPGEFKIVTDFYNDLTRFQKAEIAKSFSEGGLDIGSIEDIIKDLNNDNNQYTEEEYIDHMKECYK